MLDPANDLLPLPSSPTISSVSSSDLDTESTGSFFHDRSTTLGTLMGVTFQAIAFRAPSQRRETNAAAFGGDAVSGGAGGWRSRNKAVVAMAERRRRRRRWWSLCRDEDSGPSSLGEFLEVERRFGDVAFYGGVTAEMVGVVTAREEGVLFADGRVLPPVQAEDGQPSSSAGVLCRFPVSLTGICSGGVG